MKRDKLRLCAVQVTGTAFRHFSAKPRQLWGCAVPRTWDTPRHSPGQWVRRRVRRQRVAAGGRLIAVQHFLVGHRKKHRYTVR